MKIALIQYDTLWEDKTSNLKKVAHFIETLPDDVELVVLPEMFTTGFSMKPEPIAETESGNAVQWMISMAKKHQIAITGSLVISENKKFYNRLFFVFPDGKYQTYDKRHLFTLAGEEKVYTPGNDKIIVDYKGWKICPLVCYDLRFPVFSRIVNENYDLLLYVASWPDRRMFAWNALLKARAIENMSYVIGVNRSGTDPNGIYYSGHSQALDMMGEYLAEPLIDEKIAIVTLDKEKLKETRSRYAFLKDADSFIIK